MVDRLGTSEVLSFLGYQFAIEDCQVFKNGFVQEFKDLCLEFGSEAHFVRDDEQYDL